MDEYKAAKSIGKRGHRAKSHWKNKKPDIKKVPENTGRAIQEIIDVEQFSDEEFTKEITSSNHSQFEISDDDVENEELNGGDFECFLSRSTGEHILFNSEKSWEHDEDISKSITSDLFQLNVVLLNSGLQTIPFYKCMDYDPSMFTRSEIQRMNQESEIAENLYKEDLKRFSNKNVINLTNSESRKTSANSSKSEKKTKQKINAEIESQLGKDDELDELLSLTTSNVAKVSLEDDVKKPVEINIPENNTETNPESGQKVDAGNKEDIQQWLDDILDE